MKRKMTWIPIYDQNIIEVESKFRSHRYGKDMKRGKGLSGPGRAAYLAEVPTLDPHDLAHEVLDSLILFATRRNPSKRHPADQFFTARFEHLCTDIDSRYYTPFRAVRPIETIRKIMTNKTTKTLIIVQILRFPYLPALLAPLMRDTLYQDVDAFRVGAGGHKNGTF